MIGDPRVPEHQFPTRFRTPELNELLLKKAIEHWAQHGFGPWNGWLGEELIGRVGLISSTFEGRDCVEAKWFLSPDHVGVTATPPRPREPRSTRASPRA